ncbi:MAG: UvrD-helicase domain-containing protein [Saprospiraceae bacterium]|nr:UvrD-helicase domain-containing protein [Saprospiraceae bacterium]
MSDLFSSTARSTVEFETAYNKLNQAQQKAVEHIQGPVMVIAGPGTGKLKFLQYVLGIF